MGIWEYGVSVLGKNLLGHNIQGDHPIQVALRQFQTLGEYNRAVSAAEKEFVILAETGKGLFHTELGKLQLDIGRRKIAGDLYRAIRSALENFSNATGQKFSIPAPDPRLILSEGQLVEETLNAYKVAAKATGAVVDEAALSRALLSHYGTLFKTGGDVASKLEKAPSIAKIVETVGGMRRFAPALEFIEPILAGAKPVLKKLGPLGIFLGILALGSEAYAAGTARSSGDAATHGLNAGKEGLYLTGFVSLPALIPAVAISATQTIDKRLGVTDRAAANAIKLTERYKELFGGKYGLFGSKGYIETIGMASAFGFSLFPFMKKPVFATFGIPNN
jgi:hypothetical protein